MGEQDERIARLTELARKAWPDLDLQPDVDVEMEDRNAFVWQIGFTDHTLVRIVQHDRAHEALEAALRSLAGEPSAAEQELQKRVGELEQLLAVQRHEGLLSIARRERDQFEQELQRLRAELAEAKAVAKAACETMATEPRKQERELRDGLRALLAEYTREVGTDPQRQVTREQVPVPHDRLRKLL